MALADLAARLAAAGDELAGAAGGLTALDPGARAFGADAAGAFGELGREFYACWAGAAAAREREATNHADRLTDLAYAVRQAIDDYQQVEQAVHDLPPMEA